MTVEGSLEFKQIDSATPPDFVQLSRLHQAAFTAIGQVGWTQKSLAESCAMAGSLLMVAFRDEHPVGFAVFRCVLDEAELITLAVDPEHQGKSIASKLIKWSDAQLIQLGICSVFLEVRTDNRPAIRLYENIGFQSRSVRKGYYKLDDGSRVDGVIYAKILT